MCLAKRMAERMTLLLGCVISAPPAKAAVEKTVSGVYIPDNAKEKPMQGKVIAVGPGKKDENGKSIPMEIKVGDQVLYGKYSGTEVSVEGKDYLIVRESDVFAIL